MLEGGKATTASDVFSFGSVLFEILTWRLPWMATPPLQVRWAEEGRSGHAALWWQPGARLHAALVLADPI